MEHRIPVLRGLLDLHGGDALWLSFVPDVRWACGFTGSNGLLVVTREAAHFVTDGRYETQAAEEVGGAEVHVAGGALVDLVAEEGLLGNAHRLLVQADHLSVSAFDALADRLPGCTLIGEDGLLARHVAVKDADAVERIRRAQALTDEVFAHVVGLLRPGMTEREVAAEIVYAHLRRGADAMSFDPIVASGPNAALPHARPTDRRLRQGELVLLDFGCFLDGYASDMTRTVALGEPGGDARRVYALVRDALAAALDAARSGLTARALDATARDVIDAGGCGERFTHSLGHGVGLQVHEWPRVSYRDDDVLPENAVITLEPGVYLPGRFGVRIEDLVVLRREGCDNLTASPKELLVL